MIFAAKLNTFEGPLDLLMHLIEKNKIDIYDIPISDVTDQYLEYISRMDEQDADIMSEFLVMAATLLDIKARMLLPKETDEEDNEEDPRAELVQQLLEYKLYKYMSAELKDRSIDAGKNLYKNASIPEEVAEYEAPIDLDHFLGDLTIIRLRMVFDDVMSRSNEKINTEAVKFGNIKREEVKIEDRISYVRKKIHKGDKISFRTLLSEHISKINAIVTFLAVLELMKTGEIGARMSGENDIEIFKPEINDAEGKAEISD